MNTLLAFMVGLFVGTTAPEVIKGLWGRVKKYFKKDDVG